MSFNKRLVRPLDEVKQEYEKLGHEAFVRKYIKADAFIGPKDSIDFIHDRFESKYVPFNKKLKNSISKIVDSFTFRK